MNPMFPAKQRTGWAACLFLALVGGSGCIENPYPDPRLAGKADTSAANLSVTVPFENGSVRIYLAKGSSSGQWKLVAENLSPRGAGPSTLLYQLAPPTSLGFGIPGGPDFYLTPLYEEVIRVADLPPGQRTPVKVILLDPYLGTPDLYLKVIRLEEGPGQGRFSASGYYGGEYFLKRGDSLERVGNVKGVVDATGRMGFSLQRSYPSQYYGSVLGNYREDATEKLEFLNVSIYDTSFNLPVDAWRREAYGFSLRIPVFGGDTLEMRSRRNPLAQD